MVEFQVAFDFIPSFLASFFIPDIKKNLLSELLVTWEPSFKCCHSSGWKNRLRLGVKTVFDYTFIQIAGCMLFIYSIFQLKYFSPEMFKAEKTAGDGEEEL